jgi:hypothetical protein
VSAAGTIVRAAVWSTATRTGAMPGCSSSRSARIFSSASRARAACSASAAVRGQPHATSVGREERDAASRSSNASCCEIVDGL